MPKSSNSPTGVTGEPPGFVRARLNTTSYDKWMHEACYMKALSKGRSVAGKGIWKQLMMNNFFKNKICMGCHVKLQCNCSQYKVTEPSTGKCNHEHT